MIRLTRLSGAIVVVNADVIESFQATPDTVLRLTNGQRLAVRETLDEVVEKAVAYQRKIRRPERLEPCCGGSTSPLAGNDEN